MMTDAWLSRTGVAVTMTPETAPPLVTGRRHILAAVVCYNTDARTQATLSRVPSDRPYDLLVVNDGSTDATKDILQRQGFLAVHHVDNQGVGAAIKTAIQYALDHGYDLLVILAGNNKDDPGEIPRLLEPLLCGECDYVQGSRFLPGGRWDNLPAFRYRMVKVHAAFVTWLTGVRCTDALNGFRAYRLSLFRDARINVWQSWLDGYELEAYLHYQVLKLGYRMREVPVSKIYPPSSQRVKHSHIRPVIDWWSILRPLVLLPLGIKR